MYDIIALGEVLIDVVAQTGPQVQMTGNAGGAPANCLAEAARLGARCAIVSKAGDDALGRWLQQTLEAQGVDTHLMRFDRDRNTTLAMVSLDEQGDRSFRFYRSGCADLNLQVQELPLEDICAARVFHFGSVSMTAEPARSATLTAARAARAAGVLISFDPNLRETLWASPEEARAYIRAGMELADVVKLSGEELRFLTGVEELEAAAEQVWQQYKPGLLCVTCGARGCICYSSLARVVCAGFVVDTVDSTGAGDAFDGAMLYHLVQNDCRLDNLDRDTLTGLATFACAAGALTTTKLGAIAAMPDGAQVAALIQRAGTGG